MVGHGVVELVNGHAALGLRRAVTCARTSKTRSDGHGHLRISTRAPRARTHPHELLLHIDREDAVHAPEVDEDVVRHRARIRRVTGASHTDDSPRRSRLAHDRLHLLDRRRRKRLLWPARERPCPGLERLVAPRLGARRHRRGAFRSGRRRSDGDAKTPTHSSVVARSSPMSASSLPRGGSGAPIVSLAASAAAKRLSALQSKFQKRLQGGQFRWLNEKLYTMHSDDAVEMFREDPSLFSAVRGAGSGVRRAQILRASAVSEAGTASLDSPSPSPPHSHPHLVHPLPSCARPPARSTTKDSASRWRSGPSTRWT